MDPVDYGRRLKFWVDHGFPDLGDDGGNGIGKTTLAVLEHSQFDKNPEAVSIILNNCCSFGILRSAHMSGNNMILC